MASFKISLKNSAEKDLRRIDKSQIARIVTAIQELSTDPFPPASRKLVGSERTYRLRVGDYRVVYLVSAELHEIEVQMIRHRKEVYR